jgi:Flp pilus assembly protein TadG
MVYITKNNRLHLTKQSGAVAIEFASLFLLFFVVFYALISYALAMLLQLAMVHAAAEGARAAIAVDPLAYTSNSAYFDNGVQPKARSTVGSALSWLPEKARDKVLGAANAQVQATINNEGVLTVQLIYANYATDPLLPVLNIPLIGAVPRLPNDLSGMAQITLTN